MAVVARKLTEAEIAAISAYYQQARGSAEHSAAR
jgi:cytochrome c553